MRHRVKGKKLSRSTPHRKATLKALSTALIKEHRIQTTLAKAKELRSYVEHFQNFKIKKQSLNFLILLDLQLMDDLVDIPEF